MEQILENYLSLNSNGSQSHGWDESYSDGYSERYSDRETYSDHYEDYSDRNFN